MASRPDRLDRRSRRLRGRSYARPGGYFVTICAQNGACLFGRVVHKQMRLNPAGRMVARTWEQLERRFVHIALGPSVVMPNHFHGIVRITGAGTATLGDLMHWFKSVTTNRYIRGVKKHGWTRFDGRLWQRNYFDRILRDEDESMRAESYVRMNPARWWYDSLHPRAC